MIQVEKLQRDTFDEFGFYADLFMPHTPSCSEKPVEFFPDIMRMYSPNNICSISSVKVEPRPFLIDQTEYHSFTYEATLPIDGDMIIHVGPPTHGEIPNGKFRAFYVPTGTMVVLKPGVFHGAPFTVDGKPHTALVLLPERTYVNDCRAFDLPEDQILEIAAEEMR